MSQIIRNTIRVNLDDAFSLEGDKDLFDKIVIDQVKHAGHLRPSKVWDLEIGGHGGKQYFESLQRGENVELGAYNDDRYYESFSSLQKMLEPFVGSTGLQTINKDIIEKYYTYLKGIDHLDILSNYFDANGQMKSQAEGLLITDLGSIIDVNVISALLEPAATGYRIIEVGGGYGRLAEVFLNMYEGNVKYILLDAVPASLMYSYLYLSKNFPDRRIGFYYNEDPFDIDSFDCYIMPAWHFDRSKHEGRFDCCINIQSMQEMSQHHIDYYLNLFNKVLKDSSGIAYLSNEKDYIFQGEWNYPKNWKLVLKTRTPRSWTRNSPTEVFLKSAGSFEKENRLVDFIYSLQLSEFDRHANQLKTISTLQSELRKKDQQNSNLQLELHSNLQEITRLQKEIAHLQFELQNSRQEAASLRFDLQNIQQEVASLSSTLSRMPLASEELTLEKAEESLRNLYAYYYSKDLPEVTLLFENITKIHARLVAANLCLRYGRYRRALEHLIRIVMMDPLALFSVQAIRIIGNGLIHHRQNT